MAGKSKLARGALEALTDIYKKQFDSETYYHATPMGKLEGGKFDPNFSFEDDGGLGATYFTKDKKYGNTAADFWKDIDPDSDWSETAIYPVNIKTKNLFDYNNQEHIEKFASEINLSAEELSNLKSGDPYILENKEIQKLIKKLGFRGYHVDEPGTVGLFYPDKGDVRSIFAKFDPKKSKSGNILASVPIAAMGIDALSELEDD